MDGMHDLGGTQGFGPVVRSPKPTLYHHRWELQTHALGSAMARARAWNVDEQRHAIERMEPRHYVRASYYERQLTAFATLFVEKGLTTEAQLAALAGGTVPLSRPITPGRVRTGRAEPFAPGERVRMKSESVRGHTRLPAYARGKPGTVVALSAVCAFPDAVAHAMEAVQQQTYDVRFAAKDLWPDGADDAYVHVTVFHSYMDALEDRP